VAVKVIRADLAADHEFRARFRREVDAARKVNGLYTALVVDADLDGPMPWLATAYVAGPSLAKAVTSEGPLPGASVLTLAAGLAEGLAAIHVVGVVHRDLKPANVLLADDGPRVIDFGISRAAEASALTHTGLLVGSPGFMSPEQAEGGEVGSPSDVFSLGAVLTFAATGHGPFGAGSTAALVYRVVHGAPGLGGCPAEIRSLIERCLAKEPGQRPAAEDLLAELGDIDFAEGWPPVPADHDAVWRAAGARARLATVADRETPDRSVTGEVPEIGAERTVTHPLKPAASLEAVGAAGGGDDVRAGGVQHAGEPCPQPGRGTCHQRDAAVQPPPASGPGAWHHRFCFAHGGSRELGWVVDDTYRPSWGHGAMSPGQPGAGFCCGEPTGAPRRRG